MKPFGIVSSSSSSAGRQGDSNPSLHHLSEHLSNERTYLSYLRTAVSLISFGITINRFSLFLIQSNKTAEPTSPRFDMVGVGRVGFGMVILGLLLMLWAGFHFSMVGRGIDNGTYRPNERIAWIITAAVILGGGISLIWLFPR